MRYFKLLLIRSIIFNSIIEYWVWRIIDSVTFSDLKGIPVNGITSNAAKALS